MRSSWKSWRCPYAQWSRRGSRKKVYKEKHIGRQGVQNDIIVRCNIKWSKKISDEYPVKKVILFGSYADGSYTDESDVDLLVEFHTQSVSLFMLLGLKIGLERIFDKNVDVLHAPLPEDAMIEIGKALVIYES